MPFSRSLVILFALSAGASAQELRTLSGKTVKGSLVSLNDREIVLQTNSGPVATPLAQLLSVNLAEIRRLPDGSKPVLVRLLDDSLLSCKEIAIAGNECEMVLFSGTKIKLPIDFLVSFCRDAQNKPLMQKFEQIQARKVRRDRIIILREGEPNALEGLVGDADNDGKKIKFKPDTLNEFRDIPVERLQGVIYFRNEVPGENPLCRVIDAEGNALVVKSLAFDDKGWQLVTLFGAKVSLPAGGVAKLDFNYGRLTYLSDMEPARAVERSGIGLLVKYRKDVNLDGEPLILETTKYAKGLSLHAYTELEYNLGGKYKEFKAVLGIDLRTGAESQPLVTIYCDGEKRFSEVVTTRGVRPVALNIKDVQTLKIVVSSRNPLDLHDHVTIADARVSQ